MFRVSNNTVGQTVVWMVMVPALARASHQATELSLGKGPVHSHR